MLKKITSTFFTKGIVACINLVVLLIASKQLGGAVIGQMSLIVLNMTIVQICNEVYTGSALVYFIPKLSLRNMYSKGLVWTFVCVLTVNSVLFLFGIGSSHYFIQCILLSLLLCLHSFHMVILLAKEKIRTYNFLLLLQAFLTLVSLYASVFRFSERNIFSYLTALFVAYTGVMVLSALKVFALLKTEEGKSAIPMYDVIKKGLTNQMGNLAHTLSNRFNYYMIGSSLLLGVYSNATSLIESVWIIGGSAAPIVLSHIANTSGENNNARLTLFIAKICFILSLICTVFLYFLPNELFILLLGKDFSQTKSLMLYLSPGVLAISFSTIISHYFSGQGEQRVQLIANSAGLAFTLIFSSLLISRFGLTGACYTASVSYSIQSVILLMVFLKRQNLNWKLLFSVKV